VRKEGGGGWWIWRKQQYEIKRESEVAGEDQLRKGVFGRSVAAEGETHRGKVVKNMKRADANATMKTLFMPRTSCPRTERIHIARTQSAFGTRRKGAGEQIGHDPAV